MQNENLLDLIEPNKQLLTENSKAAAPTVTYLLAMRDDCWPLIQELFLFHKTKIDIDAFTHDEANLHAAKTILWHAFRSISVLKQHLANPDYQ